MQSNVISLEGKRRERQARSQFDEAQTQAAAPSMLLSLNLANWLASNFGDVDDSCGYDQDLQAALYFARGRVYYYRNSLHDAARAFAIVSTTAEAPDLKALTDLAYANAMYSLGEFKLAESTLNAIACDDLPEGIKKCLQVLKANILFANGEDVEEAATLYRKVLCEPSRSLWIRNLQTNIASAMPRGKDLETGKGLTRLRDILDAFIEMAASRYFASLVAALG